MRVAIQGELGSNSHLAAMAAFAAEQQVTIVSCAYAADVFARLADDSADLAMLPIENTLHGSVFEHFDLLVQHDVHAIAEVLLPVRHNLIAAPGVQLADLKRVLSHPVALSQCRRWIREHPHIQAEPVYDTAGSVKLVMENGFRDAAGIAPELAAAQYGAEILQHSIEDHRENYTRFFVLKAGQGTAPDGAGDRNKTSLVFGLEHRPGTLMGALGVLERRGLNLTRIESRPVPGRPWEYIFFVDVRYESEVAMEEALAELRAGSIDLRVLGRYRAGE